MAVYKKGHKQNFSNYRPITILFIISRLFEKVVGSSYLTDNELISSCQHGFIRGRSCETALVDLSTSLFHVRDVGMYTALAAFDHTRTFDTLDHDIFLLLLPKLGFIKSMING